MTGNKTANSGHSLVWDWPLRLFHWALLAAVVTSWVAVEFLDNTDLHVQSGQVVLGLLVFRLLWGLIGPASAQFHRFVRGPGTVLAYARGQPVRYIGHNPLGALSVVAMLVSLIVQVLTGLASDDEILISGPLVQFLSEDQVALANWVHEWNKYVLLVLIATHILAIVIYLVVKKDNLIGPMITGRAASPATETGSGQAAPGGITPRPLWLIVIAIAIAVGVAWQVFEL